MAELAKYKYLGLGTVVQVDYAEPDVKLDLWGGTVGQYDGLDRFGRVIDHRWIDYGPDPDVDVSRIQYGYDRNSNRLWRQNDVARAASKKFDQAYQYDGLNRLTDFQRGLLDGNHTIPSNDLAFRQNWGLDAVGNWSCFNQDDDGDGSYNLEQQRDQNTVNEITSITETTGPSWATPTYNAAGNTTAFPKPSDLTANYTAEYDAWNRLVRIKDGANTVQENEYDGRNFRIIKKSYSGGSLDETRHIYYTSGWQAIEERVDSSSDAERQFIWGQRYIDDLILRDHDTTGDGTLDERLYALHDANWNVTTITDASGDVQARYEYEAYGKPIYLDASWTSTSPGFDWETLFASYRFDSLPGLYRVRLRSLHAELGRWLQTDPVSYVAGTSLYQYLKSAPADLTDPLGLIEVCTDPELNETGLVEVFSGEFKRQYVLGDQWAGSQLWAYQTKDPTQRWKSWKPISQAEYLQLGGDPPPEGHGPHCYAYIYDGCIKTRFNYLGGLIEGLGDKAIEFERTLAAFNKLALAHEKNVIDKLKEVWGPPFLICDCPDAHELYFEPEYTKRLTTFSLWIRGKEQFEEHKALAVAIQGIAPTVGIDKTEVKWPDPKKYRLRD